MDDERGYEILGKDLLYQGYFRMERHRFRHRLFRGGWSKELAREVFERGHAAGVLLYDPDRDEVVLIEQFRVAAVDGPTGPWLLEIVAGIIDDEEESAEEVVRREAREEAGCTVVELRFICEYLSSPGGSSERITLFLGRVNAAEVQPGVYGLEEENEDIRVLVLPFAEAMRRLDGGEINNALAVIALLWLALHRDEIRAAWSSAGSSGGPAGPR
jgi:ADP-ribose pyrophosphatase